MTKKIQGGPLFFSIFELETSGFGRCPIRNFWHEVSIETSQIATPLKEALCEVSDTQALFEFQGKKVVIFGWSHLPPDKVVDALNQLKLF